MNRKLVLASGSPRRRELLSQLGYSFLVDVPGIDETRGIDEIPQHYVKRLAESKALHILNSQSDDIVVLGADTIVVFDTQVLEKPKDFTDSKRMLTMLSGKCHQVMTAVSLASCNRVKTTMVETNVWFKNLTEQEIKAYWNTGEPQDKAGSYGIQGIGGKFVTRIEGSYYAVVGLPLFETDQLLLELL
ncbi:Maf family protein [Vibrio salinus]|uniref:Maf family protein n=1 Tax=Vibrio salinus TaxID=2899784 RepID=UPI001E3D1851|nr:Maf family protein [Vibrio salinus]MCE0493440.1 Maf-like protein [Vibrio salinus]